MQGQASRARGPRLSILHCTRSPQKSKELASWLASSYYCLCNFFYRFNLSELCSRSRTRIRRGPRPRCYSRRRRDSWRCGRCSTRSYTWRYAWRHTRSYARRYARGHCRSSRWCHRRCYARCNCWARRRCSSAGASDLQIVEHRISRGAGCDDDVGRTRQSCKREVTGRVTLHGIRDADHHWAGRIDDRIAGTKVTTGPLAAKGHGYGVAALNSRLHPHHAACASICFQERNGCRVGRKELRGPGVIPVEDNYSIIAEVNRRQVCWRKHGKGVPGSSDGILNKGRAPRIVRLE